MSEFKFACPVCGQHITADSSVSGTQLDCPTCFQKIIVPQAPTGAASNLILSATQVSKTRPTISEAPRARARRPLLRNSVLIGALCLLTISATATAFLHWRGEMLISILHKKNIPATPVPPAYPVPSSTFWTLDPAKAVIPESPAAGCVRGQGFFCERAVLRGGVLSLRQGKVWPPDLGLSVHLFVQQAEDLSGKTILVRPERPPPLPDIVVRWKDEQGQAQSEHIGSGYTLKIVFGQPSDGKMPGRIFVALPDQSKTFAGGTFEAAIRKPPPPKPQPASDKSGG